MVTRKRAKQMGPALTLGELKTDEKKPRSKTECKRKHTWNVYGYSRRCSRCGRQEEKDALRRWEPINLPNVELTRGAD